MPALANAPDAEAFVHLHVHSQYSLLDGACRIPDLVALAAARKMPAVAITDHANMFGAIEFYKKCKAAGVRPILGCELQLAPPDPATAPGGWRGGGHIVLLARTNAGYGNLVWLVSQANLDPRAPGRLDPAVLAGRTAGLFALSGCLGGVVPQALLNEGPERARSVVRDLRAVFEPDAFYVELQDAGFPEQPEINPILAEIARGDGVPVVATNDVHYLLAEDARAHQVLQAIRAGRVLAEGRAGEAPLGDLSFRDGGAMRAALGGYGDAVANSLAIAERIETDLPLGKVTLPHYEVPDGHTRESYLGELAAKGLEARLAQAASLGHPLDGTRYRARLEMELGVITAMGFAGYFLIVWDFIRYAREQKIPVGPGRGSGAGSLVAYVLAVTDIDPLAHGLLFERFLNPDRVSMPDFDIDFCMNRRDDVIRYVAQKYGADRVGQIATFHELKSRSVVHDVARVLGFPFQQSLDIAKLVPAPLQGKSCSIPEALAQEPKLRDLCKSDPKVAELIEYAKRLEGLDRHAGTHAAGVVISEKPLWETVPCFRGPAGELVSQYDKDAVEDAGLVKFDFLGLKTLTVIDVAQGLINKRREWRASDRAFDLDAVPLDDKDTYRLLCSGNTTGVFQLESRGMQDLFRKLKPDRFGDIVAAVALYRPGPLGTGMVDDYVQRKHGRVPVKYPHPTLEGILRETYGVIVYQEQVMQIASTLAGFSLGQADILRRAMGKKKPEEMAKQKNAFIDGSKARGVDERTATEIFALLEYFAGYGFNKSHSAAYALLSYRTAYLKAHYPHEFLCALLTSDKDKTDKVVRFVGEGRTMGIEILAPDINESDMDFTVVYDESGGAKIRFGLGAVKGVGESALQTILEARGDAPFQDLFDFATRVDVRRVNKAVLEALVLAGGFDGCGRTHSVTRAQMAAAIDLALERGRAAHQDRSSGQTTLFGAFDAAGESAAPAAIAYPRVESWDQKSTLARERSVLGLYLSGHPLDRYGADARRMTTATTAEVTAGSLADGTRVTLAGVVESYRERPLKTGTGRMAFFNLEDLSGRVEVIVRARAFVAAEAFLKSGEPIVVSGVVQVGAFGGGGGSSGADEDDVGEPKIVLEEAIRLGDQIRARTQRVQIRLRADAAARDRLVSLRDVLGRFRGRCTVSVHVVLPSRDEVVVSLPDDLRVEPSEEMLSALDRLFGERVVECH